MDFTIRIGSGVCRTLRAIGLATDNCYDHDGMVVLGGLTILLAVVICGAVWIWMHR